MRIHADNLNQSDLIHAAQIARVDIVSDIGAANVKGSRSRDHAFDVKLEGESRRRPNGGQSGAGTGYAATWGQWGVFLSVLFDLDDTTTIPSVYRDADAFHTATAARFSPDGESGRAVDSDSGEFSFYWPADAHGDHRFKFAGTPRSQSCTKCSAKVIPF